MTVGSHRSATDRSLALITSCAHSVRVRWITALTSSLGTAVTSSSISIKSAAELDMAFLGKKRGVMDFRTRCNAGTGCIGPGVRFLPDSVAYARPSCFYWDVGSEWA